MVERTRKHLIDTGSLAAGLDDPALRIFECTVLLEVGPEGVSISPGREAWTGGHIPGSDFLDLTEELADTSSAFRFMRPSTAQFEAVMSAHGVGDGARVVLYDRRGGTWAARVWWLMRAFGLDDVVLLDGGFAKWVNEGRPTSTAPAAYPPVRFQARPRAGVFVDKEDVLAAIDDAGVHLVNGLPEALYRGDFPITPDRRPGRIPGSSNVPAESLVDPATQELLPESQLRARFAAAGVPATGRVIAYCGGGISASGVAFALAQVGYDDVAIYDASLEEWSADPTLPLEVG